jgi:hypothetical protein
MVQTERQILYTFFYFLLCGPSLFLSLRAFLIFISFHFRLCCMTHTHTHTQQKHPCTSRDFFWIRLYSVLYLYSLLCLDCPALCHSVFTYNTQLSKDTDIHAFGGNRSRKPSKRAAAESLTARPPGSASATRISRLHARVWLTGERNTHLIATRIIVNVSDWQQTLTVAIGVANFRGLWHNERGSDWHVDSCVTAVRVGFLFAWAVSGQLQACQHSRRELRITVWSTVVTICTTCCLFSQCIYVFRTTLKIDSPDNTVQDSLDTRTLCFLRGTNRFFTYKID